MQRNKKKFSDGLETMFQRTLFEDNPQDNPTLLAEPQAAHDSRKKAAHKSFSGSLEQFLEDTINEAIEDKVQEIKEKGLEQVQAEGPKRRNKKPVIGLDLLIRSTLEGSEMAESDKKRITFTFDKDKVERLREIADKEHARIRDIVDELVTNFIQNYSWKTS